MKILTNKNILLILIPIIFIIICVAIVTAQQHEQIDDSDYFILRSQIATQQLPSFPTTHFLNKNHLKSGSFGGFYSADDPDGGTSYDGPGVCPNIPTAQTMCTPCNPPSHIETQGFSCNCPTNNDLTCGSTCFGDSCQGTCEGGITCDIGTCGSWDTCGGGTTCDGTDTCDGTPVDPHTCYGHTCHYTCEGGLTCGKAGTTCSGTKTCNMQPTCDGQSKTCDGGPDCQGQDTQSGYHTCVGLTCGKGTCDGASTCDGSTCWSGTCDGSTCSGWTCGQTCEQSCSGDTCKLGTCDWQGTCDIACMQTSDPSCGETSDPSCQTTSQYCSTSDSSCGSPTSQLTCGSSCGSGEEECEECSDPDDVELYVGQEYTFNSPCPESGITSWSIDGIPSDYIVVASAEDDQWVRVKWNTSGIKHVKFIWENGSCSDTSKYQVNVIEVDLTIYNGGADLDNGDSLGPQGPVVYGSEEESLGACLLVNWDDDDGDGVFSNDQWQSLPKPDLYENSVECEDNLAQLKPSLNPFLDEGVITLEVISGTDKILFWKYSTKGEELPLSMNWNLANEQERMEFWEFQMYGLWIEGIEYSGSERDVTIQLTYNGPIYCEDTVKATVVMMNLGNAVYRDNLVDFPPGIDNFRGHTAIVYKYVSICTKDELCKDINYKLADMQYGEGVTLYRSLRTITEFVPGEGPTTPRGCYTNPSITYQQRLMIIYTAKVLGSKPISYTGCYVLFPLNTWDGKLSTITHLRCDGLVEVLYEFNGVDAWGRERWYDGFMYGINYDITDQGDDWGFGVIYPPYMDPYIRWWSPFPNSLFDNQEEHNEWCDPFEILPWWAGMLQPATQAGYVMPIEGAHTKFEFQVLCRPIGSSGCGN